MPPANSRHDDVTEPIALSAPAQTRELPVVGPDPADAPDDTAAGAAPAAPVAAPAAAPTRSRRGLVLAVAGLAALAIAAGATAGTLLPGRGDAPAAAPSRAAAPSGPVQATVSSLDPDGASGFERRGADWRTQTYRTAAFGGLKPGVGLVLDLGSPRAVTSVTFEARTPGSTVSLRAADAAPTSGTGLNPVGAQVTASGRTVLDGSAGGKHRYWVVWVSGLGPRGDGYGATFGTPQVTGPPAG